MPYHDVTRVTYVTCGFLAYDVIAWGMVRDGHDGLLTDMLGFDPLGFMTSSKFQNGSNQLKIGPETKFGMGILKIKVLKDQNFLKPLKSG